ncbi:MAG: starch synthase [Nitrosomonadales bacterium SCN 54-20]|nr:MAG: starch synthase [Nitrosomonadales bacterium SCN 54-20]
MTPARSHPHLDVLFITPEIHPLNKTGGLGEVSAALPTALSALGADMRILVPGYPQVLNGLKNKQKIAEFAAQASFPAATLLSAKLPFGTSGNVPLFIIDCPELYWRDGGPYTDVQGHNWPDNALRFGLLSKIGAILASDASPLDWHPDVVHCNDWQSGLVPAYLHFHKGTKAASLMVIHNLAFQGVFSPETVSQLGLPQTSFQAEGVEYYGGMSFLKAGLYYCDHIVTVSPTYAREIQVPPLGFGMEGLLSRRHERITGIVNGISDEWDPVNDPYLEHNYSMDDPSGKAINKTVLQQQLGLTVDADIPLFGAVSRLTYQKGYDLLLRIVTQLIDMPGQLVILGNGEAALEQELMRMARNHPGKIAVRVGFDEKLAHLIEAGADSFLMPSRFEPCGLNQMYSQYYGTPPLVHGTGGLLDTVVDCTPVSLADETATGFVFHELTPEAFLGTLERTVAAYRDKPVWRRLMRNGMAKDFSWRASAIDYRKIYLSLLSQKR